MAIHQMDTKQKTLWLKLTKLETQATTYQQAGPTSTSRFSCTIGQHISAVWSGDGSYYDADVVSIDVDTGTITVNRADGGTDNVSFSDSKDDAGTRCGNTVDSTAAASSVPAEESEEENSEDESDLEEAESMFGADGASTTNCQDRNATILSIMIEGSYETNWAQWIANRKAAEQCASKSGRQGILSSAALCMFWNSPAMATN